MRAAVHAGPVPLHFAAEEQPGFDTSASPAQPSKRAFRDRLGDENARPAHLIASLIFGSTFSAKSLVFRAVCSGVIDWI